MKRFLSSRTLSKLLTVAAFGVFAACLPVTDSMAGGMSSKVALSGAQEVPPVTTSASGEASITVAADGAVSGSITTKGVVATMAHIHMAPAGQNGPVVVPMTQTADGVWSIAAGAKLTADQLKAYQAGELYVNVHSAEHKGGEIRAQLKP
jgi:hypothetical protein